MKKSNLVIASIVFAVSPVFIASCHKDSNNSTDVTQLKKDILSTAATTVCQKSYEDLSAKSQLLLTAVQTLTTTTNDANLAACQTLWKDIRQTWERSESWLIGPVEADDIDPRIDTWPVDFNDLNAILASTDVLDEPYVDALPESLKGFHPIEYLLWGQNGAKVATDFTAREKEFLSALTLNLNKLCGEVKTSWTGGYTALLANAGAAGNTEYPTTKAAYEALVDAMADICGEVADSKMKDPFDQQDPTQEESPFAKNSIIDFTNNIQGIMIMYQANFSTDGKGIEDLVRNYNLSLDAEIKEKHAAAIASLHAITDPFGVAIHSQPTQVANAISKITDLATELTTKLKPFVQQYGQ